MVFQKGNQLGKGNIGIKRTEEQLEALRKAHEGQKPWNTGLSGYKIKRKPNTKAGLPTRFKCGNEHPNYKGGKEDHGTTKREWKEIQMRILNRDNWACQNKECNKDLHSFRFNINHKIPFRTSKDNSDNNLISYCVSCHIRKEYENGF